MKKNKINIRLTDNIEFLVKGLREAGEFDKYSAFNDIPKLNFRVDGIALEAIINGNIVGQLQLGLRYNLNMRSAYINIFIDKEHRRKGIGKLLVKQSIKHCKIFNVNFVSCLIKPKNIASSSLFSECGFTKIGVNPYAFDGNRILFDNKWCYFFYPPKKSINCHIKI